MAFVAALVEKSELVYDFVNKTHARLHDAYAVGNVIEGYAYVYVLPEKYLVVVQIEAMTPFVTGLFFNVLQCRFFVRWALKKGLRKDGFDGDISFLSSRELMKTMSEELR